MNFKIHCTSGKSIKSDLIHLSKVPIQGMLWLNLINLSKVPIQGKLWLNIYKEIPQVHHYDKIIEFALKKIVNSISVKNKIE